MLVSLFILSDFTVLSLKRSQTFVATEEFFNTFKLKSPGSEIFCRILSNGSKWRVCLGLVSDVGNVQRLCRSLYATEEEETNTKLLAGTIHSWFWVFVKLKITFTWLRRETEFLQLETTAHRATNYPNETSNQHTVTRFMITNTQRPLHQFRLTRTHRNESFPTSKTWAVENRNTGYVITAQDSVQQVYFDSGLKCRKSPTGFYSTRSNYDLNLWENLKRKVQNMRNESKYDYTK